MLRAYIEAALFVALMAWLLFGAAGRLDWPMAWAFLIGYAIFCVIAFGTLDPSLIRERARVPPGIRAWDLAVSTLFFVLLYPATLYVCGRDFKRGWSLHLPLGFQVAALAIFLLGYSFSLWAMRANVFFAAFVRIQDERGHRLVADGPYAYVRHPGYAGAMLAHLALPLALGSLWGLAPALGGIALLAVRTWFEDRTLERELTGYREYQRRVGWRLLPGVW